MALKETAERLAAPVRKISGYLLCVLAGAWALARFVGLGSAPPGFFIDECRVALHTMCLAERGRDGDDQAWPLLSHAFADGHHPFTLTDFDVGWTRVFGTSIAAFRAASAFWIIVTALALFGAVAALEKIVRTSEGQDADKAQARTPFAPLVLFAALLSPWSFQYARIAWEGPLAPAYLALALFALCRLRLSGRFIWAVVVGVATAFSMISYPPLRVAVPPVIATVAVTFWLTLPRASADGGIPLRRRFLVRLVVAGVVAVAAFSPIIVLTLQGKITGRTMDVAIFSPKWLDGHRGPLSRTTYFFITLADNIATHLRPSYLFFTGDPNSRHSAHIVGQLSPVDIVALVVATAGTTLLARLVLRQMRAEKPVKWPQLSRLETVEIAVAAFAVVGGFFATLPAALTHEGIPHSLRSIGAWPFVALFTGSILALGWHRLTWLPPVVAVVATIYTAVFFSIYPHVYDAFDANTFTRRPRDAVEETLARNPPAAEVKGAVENALAPFSKTYEREALRYYFMHYAGTTCADSGTIIEDLRRR